MERKGAKAMSCAKPEKHCRCGAWVVTEAATFRDYECGTTWCEIDGWEFSEKCKKNREE